MATSDQTTSRISTRSSKGINPKFNVYDTNSISAENKQSNSVPEVNIITRNKQLDNSSPVSSETGNTSNINKQDYSVIMNSLSVLPSLKGSVNDLIGKITNVLSELSNIKIDINNIKAVLGTKAEKYVLAKLEERVVKLEAVIDARANAGVCSNDTQSITNMDYAAAVKENLRNIVREEIEEKK